MSTFSRNWKHHWKCREQKGNFQTASVITFWNLKNFGTGSSSHRQNETRYLVPSITNLVQ